MTDLGSEILSRLEQAAAISSAGPGVTRFSFTREHRAVGELIERWMRAAGLNTRWDAAGNLIGRAEGSGQDRRTVMLGSHQDSVRQGGRYDGMLGVVLPLVCLQALRRDGVTLPFPVEVIAFSDEEGGRFTTSLIGSKAIAGCFDPAALATTDADGVSLEQAMRTFGADPDAIGRAAHSPHDTRAFIEVHIEQGPVLESRDLALGAVTAITGIERHRVVLTGKASHAGTTPMDSRRDALAGAAELVTAVNRICRETEDCVGVVGEIAIEPNVVNVIPARARLTIELRSPHDSVRIGARDQILRDLHDIAGSHRLAAESEKVYEQAAVSCAPWLIEALERAIAATGRQPLRLFSGAGHDGLAMVNLTDIGMLFVRCKDGLSHHPDESITAADAAAAAEVLLQLFRQLG